MTIMAHLLAVLLLMSADPDICVYATSATDSLVTVEYDTVITQMEGVTGDSTVSPKSNAGGPQGTNTDPAEASAGNIDTATTSGPTTGPDPIHSVTFEASTTFTELNYTEDLANSSSPAFIERAEQFSSKLKTAYCTAALIANCSVEIEVTGFRQGSLIIDYNIIYFDTSESALDDFREAILDLEDIVILNDQGEQYAIIYTVPVVIVAESSTVSLNSQGNLTCYTCTTSDESDSCYTGQVASLRTEQCLEGQRCLTVLTKNETYKLITRGCQSSSLCTENNMNSALYCQDSQTSGTKCSHCCNSDECNRLHSGTVGIQGGIFTWLIGGLSILTTGTMRL